MTLKGWIVLVVLVATAFAGGWFGGRMHLDRQWRDPRVQIDGKTVLRPMPLARTRLAVAVAPLVPIVAAVGRDEGTVGLHVGFENRTGCKVTGYKGLAYAFDAHGRPAPILPSGALYAPLEASGLSIEPGAKYLHDTPLDKAIDRASLVVPELDEITCEGGKVAWKRS